MNNPLRILTGLDRHLQLPVELNIYGRSAIALGVQPEPPFSATMDVDLILTKTMRVDPEDREDIRLLASKEKLSRSDWETVFEKAQVPDLKEIHEAFEDNREWFFQEVVT